MKKILFQLATLAIILTFSLNVQAQLSLNLEAHYDFSGNTDDISGNANHATPMNGVALTDDRFGNPNSAYIYDGIDDYMELPTDFDFSTRSINLWVKADTFSSTLQAIYDVNHGGLSHGTFQMYINSGASSITLQSGGANHSEPIALGTWYMLTIVRDSANTDYYVDANLIGTSLSSFANSSDGSSFAHFGCTRVIDRFFDGTIDDVRIYSRKLALCEIRELRGLPAVTASGTAAICSGESTDLTAGGASTYTWDNGAGTDSLASVSPIATTTYTVTGTDTSGCIDSAQVTVTVNQLPTVTTSGAVAICDGQSTDLTADGASTYAWDNGGGTDSLASVTPDSTTIYTVIGTDAFGCIDTAHATVTVNALPTVTASGTATICDGQSTDLTALGASTYAWDNGAGTDAMASVSPSSTTTYTVTGTDTLGCTNTALAIVTVNALPTVTTSGAVAICSGESTDLTAGGASTYAWDNGAGTDALATVSPDSTTTYTVTGTDTLGCSDTAQAMVTVNALPTVTASGTATICEGESTDLTAGGASTYTWDNGGGTGSPTSVSPSTTTTYTVTGTDTFGCTETAQATVTVTPLPDVSVSQTGEVLTALNVNMGITYQWVDCNNSFAAISGETSQTYTATDNGGYAVVINENSCADTSICYDVTSVGIFDTDFGNDFTLYPNPTDGNFSIDLGESRHPATLTIMDLAGRIIQSSTNNENQLVNLNLDGPAGVYLLMIESGDKRAVIRVLKN